MIEGLLAAWGLPLVALGTLVEGDTVAIVAGALAHRGLLSWPAVAVAAALGAFLSDQIWFHLGRGAKSSPRVAALLARPLAQRLTESLGRHPVAPLLLFRLIWGTRLVAPVLFGATGVDPRRFLLLDAAAAASWAVLMTGIGYGLGSVVEGAVGRLHLGQHLGLVAIGVALVLAALWLGTRVWRARR